MKHIRNFENYKRTKIVQEKFNKQVEFFNDVNLNSSDEDLFINVFNKYLNQYKTDESIKLEIRNYIDDNQILNEGFFDKLKNRFPKAAEVSKKLSDKAEGVLGKVLQAAKDAVSFVKKVGEGIKEVFIKGIESGKKIFEEQIKSGKLKAKIDELAKTKKEGLINDLKVIKDLIVFYRKDFLSKLLKVQSSKMGEFLTNEQEPVVESLINEEKGNVIATLVHGIESVPPFSWLHKVAQAGEAGANKLISALSTLTEKLGGPSFQLPVIALLIGITIEQIVKGQAGGWLVSLAGSTTPLGMAITGIKTVAMFIALIVSLDAIIGEKILGGDHSHSKEETENKEETEENNK